MGGKYHGTEFTHISTRNIYITMTKVLFYFFFLTKVLVYSFFTRYLEFIPFRFMVLKILLSLYTYLLVKFNCIYLSNYGLLISCLFTLRNSASSAWNAVPPSACLINYY